MDEAVSGRATDASARECVWQRGREKEEMRLRALFLTKSEKIVAMGGSQETKENTS